MEMKHFVAPTFWGPTGSPLLTLAGITGAMPVRERFYVGLRQLHPVKRGGDCAPFQKAGAFE